jgi:fatty acid desaturase
MSDQATRTTDYLRLRERVARAGLLEPQLGFYARTAAVTAALLGGGFAGILLVDGLAARLALCVPLGFAYGRAGLLVHDLGHRQVFRSYRATTAAGLLLGNLIMGWSWSWWVADHDRHHRHPNRIGQDPSLARTFTAFTERDAVRSRGFVRFMMRHQAVFELPLYSFIALLFLIESVTVLVRGRARLVAVEAVLMVAHYPLYLALLLTRLPLGQAILIMVVQKALFGLYAGSVVAPNHKGMTLLEADGKLSYLERQVVTARNVVGSPLVDLWYGGLNSQIEHHLFPAMARNRLPAARPIVRAFCAERGIPYAQTGVLQSYREILGFLARTSAPLRHPAEEKP